MSYVFQVRTDIGPLKMKEAGRGVRKNTGSEKERGVMKRWIEKVVVGYLR